MLFFGFTLISYTNFVFIIVCAVLILGNIITMCTKQILQNHLMQERRVITVHVANYPNSDSCAAHPAPTALPLSRSKASPLHFLFEKNKKGTRKASKQTDRAIHILFGPQNGIWNTSNALSRPIWRTTSNSCLLFLSGCFHFFCSLHSSPDPCSPTANSRVEVQLHPSFHYNISSLYLTT